MPFPEYEILSKFINENIKVKDAKIRNKYGKNVSVVVYDEHFIVYDMKIHKQCEKFGYCLMVKDDEGNINAVLIFIQFPYNGGNICQIRYLVSTNKDSLDKVMINFNELGLVNNYNLDFSFDIYRDKKQEEFNEKEIYCFVRPLNINGMVRENIRFPSRKTVNEISNKKDELFFKIKKNNNIINKKVSNEDLHLTYDFVIGCNSSFKPTFEFWKELNEYYDIYFMTKDGLVQNVYFMETHYIHFKEDNKEDNKHKADIISMLFGDMNNILDIVGSFKSCIAVYFSFEYFDIIKYKFYSMGGPSCARFSKDLEVDNNTKILTF